MNKSRGRRPGAPDTRAAILDVARRRFLADGYAAVTLRSVAAEAGVDAALISYFFGSKKGLFGAALGLLANPPEVLAAALPGDPRHLPERVLTALVGTWEDPVTAEPLHLMVQAAFQDPELLGLLREVVGKELVGRIADHLEPRLGAGEARRRAGTAGTQLAGVIFARYILRVAGIAEMPADEFVAHLAPGLRAVLFAPVPPVARRVTSGRAGRAGR
ncbi:TetR family transcriptional regulator [Actinomadura sp. PM05-2]|uniref:TetR family transcriptional regulator n=2 Tax=Actinomadura parmotrematis TaxID=2864039 RepID=A0ABS7G140_9ACTN|nr:TetR family transcriptional regulator [Actinomadura parmotrematis]